MHALGDVMLRHDLFGGSGCKAVAVLRLGGYLICINIFPASNTEDLMSAYNIWGAFTLQLPQAVCPPTLLAASCVRMATHR